MSDSALMEQAEGNENSAPLSEAGAIKCQQSIGTKRHHSEAEDGSQKQGNSPRSETRPAKRQRSSAFKRYTFTAGNDSTSISPNEIEFDLEKARFDIFHHVMNMKRKVDNDDQVKTREMETWTQAGLANISGEKSPQNEIFIKSLADNFEEMIRNIGQEARRDVNHTMDDVRKTFVKLANEIEAAFRPRSCIDDVKVTRSEAVNFFWMCLLSIAFVLISIFPEYLLELFESAVVFYQSTILTFFLFCIMYFYEPSSK